MFYLIRHGNHNVEEVEKQGFCGLGLELSPLTGLGKEQAHRCAMDERLKDCNIIVSSPYTRALQTAAILASILHLDVEVEIDLREVDADLTYSVRSFNELMISRKNPLTCEKPEHAKNRILSVLEKYCRYDRVIIVTHGDLMRVLTEDRKIENCEIIEFEFQNTGNE